MKGHLRDKPPHFDDLPRAVVVMQNHCPSGMSTGWHSHPRGQLLYATEGVMVVHTEAGSWVIPPNRALWMITGLRHTVSMSGDVLMRTAYIDASRIRSMPAQTSAIPVSALLRELLIAAVDIPVDGELNDRDATLLDLLVAEIKVSPVLPLHLPMPSERRVRAICEGLIAAPSDSASAADWGATLGLSERTLHRLFARETGMTFAQWREQARLLFALRSIAEGQRILDVALACGYSSQSAFTAMFKRNLGDVPSLFYR